MESSVKPGRSVTLMAFSSQDGRIIAKLEICGDADDVFVDSRRRRVYVTCGEGTVDVLEQDGAGLCG
jgi:hypothetical protein